MGWNAGWKGKLLADEGLARWARTKGHKFEFMLKQWFSNFSRHNNLESLVKYPVLGPYVHMSIGPGWNQRMCNSNMSPVDADPETTI